MSDDFEVEISEQAVHDNNDALMAVEAAGRLKIGNDDDYERGGAMAVDLQTVIRKLEKHADYQKDPMKESRRQALEAMRRVEELYSPMLKRLKEAKQIVTGGMTAYRTEQKRIAAVAKALAEAEARTREAEARKRREDAAAELEQKGHPSEAQMLRKTAPPVVEVALYQPPTPKVKGVVEKRETRARVDLQVQHERLAEAIDAWNSFHTDRPIVPEQYWRLEVAALGAHAKQTDGMVPIKGVEFYEHEDTQPRSR